MGVVVMLWTVVGQLNRRTDGHRHFSFKRKAEKNKSMEYILSMIG